MMEIQHPAPSPAQDLDRKITRSRRMLAIERAWPLVWLPLGVAALFLIASLAGAWVVLPQAWHAAGLAGFALAGLVSLVPLIRLPYPTRAEGLARLERQSGVPHRPVSSYEDQLSPVTAGSPAAQGLWAAHRARLERLIAAMRPARAAPRTEPSDPLALRALALLSLAVLVLVTGDAFADRLASAFRFGEAAQLVPTRLDAWVRPPAYTGKQAFLLVDGSTQAQTDQESSRRFEVPEGSEVLVRATGPAHANFSVVQADAGAARPVALKPGEAVDANATVSEFKVVLTASTTLRLVDGGANRQSWAFEVVPDTPPVITLNTPPKAGARGALSLDYRITDDYGVASAEARFVLDPKAEPKPLTLPDGSVVGPLGEAPKQALKLAKSKTPKDMKGKTSVDLAAHPWAGAPVTMTLTARDRGNHTGDLTPETFALPERPFRNPLARAIVEQRRILGLQPARYRDVRLALDAFAIAPDKFPIPAGDYLALRSAFRQLSQTPTREIIEGVHADLWKLALSLESGNLSDAEKRLRDAEDRLSKALEEGATDEEIAKLMQELRQAMAEFMRQLAEQAQKNGQQAQRQNGQQLTSRDLQEMLKQMEQMARSGNREGAQQLLNQLRQMMENLQAGRQPGQGGQQGQNGQMREMLDKFGNLIGKQKKLLDETFKQGRQRGQGEGQGDGEGEQGENGQGNQRMPGEGDELGELGNRQGDLRNELKRLMDELKGMTGEQPGQLDDAGRSMEDAERSLQNEDAETATENQGRALDQLRKGAQSMVEQMMRGRENGTGDRVGSRDRDPLGRPLTEQTDDYGSIENMLPNELAIQRSRRIIEELRRRLGETTRPPAELDYLERLLK